jgi:hypothetical protein
MRQASIHPAAENVVVDKDNDSTPAEGPKLEENKALTSRQTMVHALNNKMIKSDIKQTSDVVTKNSKERQEISNQRE